MNSILRGKFICFTDLAWSSMDEVCTDSHSTNRTRMHCGSTSQVEQDMTCHNDSLLDQKARQVYWKVYLIDLIFICTYITTIINGLKGVHHSAVDLFAPTIQPLQVWIQNTPSMLFSFIVYICICIVKITKINKKRSDLTHIIKNCQK